MSVCDQSMAQISFFDRNLDDALCLMAEARNYIAFGDPSDMDRLPPAAQLRLSYEVMRVAARLLDTVGRLMNAKAARGNGFAPDIDEPAMADSPSDACWDLNGMRADGVPQGLASLLDWSNRLYERVVRLQTRGGTA